MNGTQLSRLKIGAAPVVLVVALLSVPTLAQDANSAGSEDSSVIVVTGSRIARPDFSSPNPIVTADAKAIEESGKTNLTEYLSDNPALLGSTTNVDVAGSNLPSASLVGVNLLNLRNLGSSRTLVLVDGKRHVSGIAGSAAVDINTIPTGLVERVDVLTGGVSAVYGADGVSGVVNFILKKDFEGLNVRAQNGISQRGDAGERFVSVTAGKNFADGRGNIAFAYEYNEADRFSQKRRLNYGLAGPSWALVRNPADGTPGGVNDNPNVPDRILMTGLRWADSSMAGALILGNWADYIGPNGFTPPPPAYNGNGDVYDTGTYIPGTSFTVGGDSTPRESYYGDYTPFSRRHIANVLASYEFSPAFRLNAELKFVKSKAMTESQPTYDLFTDLQADNPYLIDLLGADAVNGVTFSRDNFDFGQRRYQLDRELWRGVLSASGRISDHLNYDASFVFGQSSQTATNYGDRISDRYYAALDAVDDGNGGVTCRINLPGQSLVNGSSLGNPIVFDGEAPVTFLPGQCVPLNILGEGSPSKEALNFILANHSSFSRLRQYVASFNLSGDTGAFFELPGGPVGFAVGVEYRKESSYSRPSEYSIQGTLIDNSPALIERGNFDVKELYGEIRLPILSDVALAKDLSFGAALRFSDYSTVGNTTTWNLNGTYAPVRDLTFRGTYSKSVRAPNISELFAPNSGTFEFITDPCGIDRIAEGQNPYRVPNCQSVLTGFGLNPATFNPADAPNSPEASSLLGSSGGNPMLNPEKARTWTAGLILQPSFVPNLTISFDWYDIKLTKAIQYSTAQDIVDLCYDQPTLNNTYCDLISRDPGTGFINDYNVIPSNVAAFRTSGLDMNMRYRLELGQKAGRLDLRLVGNYLDHLSFVPSLGADPENELDSASYPAPRFSANFDVTWTKGPFSFNYGIDWQDKTRRVTREQQAANPDYAEAKYIWYSEKWKHDIHASYNVADRFDLYGGVNNLFDRKPDDGAVAYPISAVGRYFYVGVKAKIF